MTFLKQTKFAMLAAAFSMLLIPAGMNTVYAEPQNISDEIDRLVEKYNLLEIDRHRILDKMNYPGLSDQQREQYQIMHDEIWDKMQRISQSIDELVEQEEEYKPTTKLKPQTGIPYGDTIFTKGDHTSCDKWIESSAGFATGFIDVNTDTIDWNTNFVDAKSVGWWPFCNHVTFEEVKIFIKNITKNQQCTMVESNVEVNTNLTQTCNCGINNGELLGYLVSTTYESNYSKTTAGNTDWYGYHRVQ